MSLKKDIGVKIRDVTVSARIYRAKTGTWEDLGVVAKRPYSRLGRTLDVLRLGFLKDLLKLAAVLTQAGEEWIVDVLDAIISNQTAFTQYGGWGTGAGTAAKVDTALFTEGSEARVATTRSQYAVDKLRHVFQIVADAGKTITNAGVLSASTDGTLILHWDHADQPLNQNDAIEYTVDTEIT
jgi:hypothetical protein